MYVEGTDGASTLQHGLKTNVLVGRRMLSGGGESLGDGVESENDRRENKEREKR